MTFSLELTGKTWWAWNIICLEILKLWYNYFDYADILKDYLPHPFVIINNIFINMLMWAKFWVYWHVLVYFNFLNFIFCNIFSVPLSFLVCLISAFWSFCKLYLSFQIINIVDFCCFIIVFLFVCNLLSCVCMCVLSSFYFPYILCSFSNLLICMFGS